MEPHFWKSRWQNKQTGFHQPQGNSSLKRFWPTLSPKAEMGVLVPLCGKSQDLLLLRQLGHPVIGVELSEIAAQEFFDDNQLDFQTSTLHGFHIYQTTDLQIWVGDFFDLPPSVLQQVAYFYDRAALIALPPAMQEPYIQKMRQLLPHTKGLLVCLEYQYSSPVGPPFSVDETRVRSLMQPDTIQLLSRHLVHNLPATFSQLGIDTMHEVVYAIER